MEGEGRALPTDMVTFLFTDIEGSAKLWERCPETMRDALADHDQILRQITSKAGGVVFKTIGDAFCCAFDCPEKALETAIDAQRALQSHVWPGELGDLRVRMGIHSGNAIERNSDYFGPTVNRVARLMSIAYGEQILLSATTAALLRSDLDASVTLRDLGRHRLRDLTALETTYQVVAPGLRAEFPVLVSVDSRANNLPSQISSFVGRETELSELQTLLRKHRLITITGPGGMGKTRLALQLAAGVIAHYDDGAWLVDLSGIRDALLILQSIATELKVREVPREPISTTLLEYLSGRHLLLVIDNAEHLLADVAATVRTLVAKCERLTLIVTSREPLHLTGEQVYRLAPMPGAPVGSDPAALSLHDGTRLFLERAHEVAPNLSITDADLAEIASLCHRLEGIPLAIELAAARVTLLSIKQLNQRLTEGLDLLSSRDSTRPRHRTLEGTIDWSYRLLVDAEKRLFESLSVFVDGLTLEACEAIATSPAAPGALDLLQSLVDKSLVTANATSLGTRYQMLDMVREYSKRRCAETKRHEQLFALHFKFFLALVTGHERAQGVQERGQWATAVDADLANCRSALKRSLDAKDPAAGAFLCGLAAFWQGRGLLTEGRSWLQRYLAEASETESLYPRALRFAAFFAASQDDYDQAITLASRLLELARLHGDRLGEGEALHSLAVAEERRGNDEIATSHYANALALFDAVENSRNSLIAILNLANLLIGSERLESARCLELLEKAETLLPAVRDEELTALACGLRGILALRRDRLSEAEAHIREALSLQTAATSARRVEDLSSLAEVRARQGALGDAHDLARESLTLSMASDEHNNIIRSLEVFAYVLFREGHDTQSIQCLGAARVLRDTFSYRSQMFFGIKELEIELRKRRGEEFDRVLRETKRAKWQTTAEALL